METKKEIIIFLYITGNFEISVFAISRVGIVLKEIIDLQQGPVVQN